MIWYNARSECQWIFFKSFSKDLLSYCIHSVMIKFEIFHCVFCMVIISTPVHNRKWVSNIFSDFPIISCRMVKKTSFKKWYSALSYFKHVNFQFQINEIPVQWPNISIIFRHMNYYLLNMWHKSQPVTLKSNWCSSMMTGTCGVNKP